MTPYEQGYDPASALFAEIAKLTRDVKRHAQAMNEAARSGNRWSNWYQEGMLDKAIEMLRYHGITVNCYNYINKKQIITCSTIIVDGSAVYHNGVTPHAGSVD